MATPSLASDFASAIDPDIVNFIDVGQQQCEATYPKLFNIQGTTKPWEKVASLSGLGMFQIQTSGQNASYDKPSQSAEKIFETQTYALECAIGEDIIEDQQAGFDVVRMHMTQLGDSARRTTETNCAQVLNKANNTTDSSALGWDGKPILSTTHPTRTGVNANKLSTPAAASYAMFQDLYQLLPNIRDDRGERIDNKMDKAIISRAQVFVLNTIMKTMQLPGGMDNDINSIRDMNIVPGGFVVWDYLESDTQTLVTTNHAKYGLSLLRKKPLTMHNDTAFSSRSVMYQGYFKEVPIYRDYRAFVGSEGA
jgi:hypothetical protein